MDKVKIDLGSDGYDIEIQEHAIRNLSGALSVLNYSKVFVITDENVMNFHQDELERELYNIEHQIIILPAGEKSKSFASFEYVAENILSQNIDRNALLIAFGGGVIGDLTGFVASTLLRGVQFLQCPTTLLAMVDSSVGGKTAINSANGKNLIGAFYQPKKVLCDISLLKTLPDRDYLSGYVEVLKYGCINDREFFDYLDESIDRIQSRDSKLLKYIVKTCCENKANIVSQDERENGVRKLLNLGHTLGHAIESLTNYDVLHGEAVAIGMVFALKLSVRLGFCAESEYQKVKNHFSKLGIKTSIYELKQKLKLEELVQMMQKDKKTTNGAINFILCKSIGKSFLQNNIDKEIILQTLQEE